MSQVSSIGDDTTIRQMLETRARLEPGRSYLRFGSESISFGELDRAVNRLANALAGLGLKAGDRVAVMLANHPDHVSIFLACAKLGLTQVPVNTRLRGAPLEYLLEHSAPRAVVADATYQDDLRPALASCAAELVIWRGGLPGLADGTRRARAFAEVAQAGAPAPPAGSPRSDDVLSISYTSGTTGLPKGVMVTDKMFRAAGIAAGLAADVRGGDTLLVWEPLFHIGGSQIIVLGLREDVTLALVDRFSASRFWDDVRRAGATHIHYLGGILALLLKQPPRPDDRNHPVRVAWGGGATAHVQEAFAERFGVEVREIYGMTEASSLTTLNLDARRGSIGKPTPYFEVRIVDDRGELLGPNRMGEMIVRSREPGLVMQGYFRDPEATARALRDGWLYTGDLASYDEGGFFYYLGRKKDSIRRRGENVSAWEVERVLLAHRDVEECAVVGVPAEVGEEEIKAFVKPLAGVHIPPADLLAWCARHLAPFQIPRYIALVEALPKTATERIQKERLSRATDDCWDRER